MCGSWGRRVFLSVLLVLGSTLFLWLSPSPTASATAGINSQLSFEGKMVKSDGTNIADGTYNMEFKIYQDGNSSGSGSTLKWTEDRLVGGTGGVTLTNGTFQVNLGSVNTALGTSVDWNQNTLWLSMQIGNSSSCTITTTFTANCAGDGEMTPFIRLTASPYALNADKLDGLDSTAFGQLASTQTWTGANLISVANTAAFKVQNTSNFGVFNVNTSTNLVSIYDGTATQGNLALSYNDGSSSGIIASSAALVLNSTTSSTVTLDSGTTGAVNVATGANAKTVTVGNQTGATALNLKSGTGSINLQPVAGGDVVFSEAAGSNLQITASAPPTLDQVAISNAGQGVTTAGINGLSINYVGGAAAVESAGERIDLTPGGTSGGTWNGLRIVANPTGPASGVTENGLKLEGPTTPGAGKEYGIMIDDNWDSGLNFVAQTTNPTPPAAGSLDVYVKSIAGRAMLKAMGSSGVDYVYQPSLFQQSIFLCVQSSTTALAGQGGPCTAVASSTAAVTTTENTGVAVKYSTTTTAGTNAGVWQTVSNYFRGSVTNGSNGFFYFTRFYLPDASYGSGATGARIFAGLSNQTTSTTMVGGDNPAGHYAGIQYSTNRGDTNWMCVTKDGTTQATPVSTGVTFAPLKQYDVYVYTPPLGTTVYIRIDNNTDGTTGECAMTTNLPGATTALRPEVFLGTLTTTARAIDFQRMYVETDR